MAACSPAQRRLFAPLGSPQRIPNGSILLQTLRALLGNLLPEKKHPREAAIFTATINDNGTVSLTAPKGYAAGYYAPYYDQLAKATQLHIAPENTYEAFRPAPTSDSLLINRVPTSALLQKAIADAVHLATGIAVRGARPSSPRTESPSSPRPWSSKSPPPTHLFSSKRGFFSSTVSAQ